MRLPYGSPNQNLLRELRQVGVDAEGVIRALGEVNVLPDEFPRAVLEDICCALSGLKNGTAENCRPTLEYARNKIPEIRRENFHLTEDEFEVIEHDLDEPRLYRGMMLDRQLNMLLASITTALDEYRVQAQERFDDEVRGEEVVSLRHPEETAAPVANATGVIATSERAQASLRDKQLDQTTKGDVLSRRLQDNRNLAYAVLSQIRAGKIVRRWFEGISAAVSRMPDLIDRAGKALKVGTDIADTLADWWSNTEHKLVKAAIDQVRDFGHALEEIGENLKRRRGPAASAPTPEKAPRDASVLRAEAEVERMLIAGIAVPVELARLVEEIDVRGSGSTTNKIARWQDVANFTSLRVFQVLRTDFELSRHGRYLADKKNLSSLALPPLNSSDLSPLADLTALTSLSLRANSATDLTPLGGLAALTSLSLEAKSARDLTPLADLTALTSLSLQANSATDLTALADLTVLTSLTVYASRATDLAPLANLTALTSLSLQANSATDLTPLGGLTGLTSLTLYANSVTDLTPLGGLTGLTSLTLYAKSVRDLTPLADLTALTTLSITAMQVTNWDAVIGSARLQKLQMTRASTRGCERIGRISSLENLYVDSRGVFDLEWLAPLKSLKNVTLRRVKTVNQAALKGVDVKIFP